LPLNESKLVGQILLVNSFKNILHLYIIIYICFSCISGLDYKKELELVRKRQQLQKELSQLEDTDEIRENLTIERKVSSLCFTK